MAMVLLNLNVSSKQIADCLEKLLVSWGILMSLVSRARITKPHKTICNIYGTLNENMICLALTGALLTLFYNIVFRRLVNRHIERLYLRVD